MIKFGRSVGAAVLLASGLVGCGGGTGIKEGAPPNIDMSKNYSPPVAVGPIQPKDMAKAKSAATTPAPAPAAK